MFFIVDKPRLQRLIAITRDDRKPDQQNNCGPYSRIEAKGNKLRLSGHETEAEFPATVYEEGVLFLRVTLFRRILQALPATEQIAVQVCADGLHVGDVTIPLERDDMLLYIDPLTAPALHPAERPGAQPITQGELFPEV